MHELGPLRMSYYVERNTVMTQRIFNLVKIYNIVKILAGDELKRDQFKFIYKVHDCIYSSALKNDYLSEQFGPHIMKEVIPEMTAYKSMILIKNIDDQKAIDAEKKTKKAEERAALGLSEEEEEELKLDLPPQPVTKNKKKKQEIDPEIIEQARIAALFKRELATYGVSKTIMIKLYATNTVSNNLSSLHFQRTWIWENYFKDDAERMEGWNAGAAALRRINVQVLEDIEDFILLKGFVQNNGNPSPIEAIDGRINRDLKEKRERQKMEQATSGEKNEDEKVDDPHELGAVEDAHRKFLNKHRPHERKWNFIQDDAAVAVPHVLRASADPRKSYIDGRVQNLLQLLEMMGAHLRMHDDKAWNHLNVMTKRIFEDREQEMSNRMEAYKQMLEDAANK